MLLILSNQPIETKLSYQLVENATINQLYFQADKSLADYYLFLDLSPDSNFTLPDEDIEKDMTLGNSQSQNAVAIIEISDKIRIYHRSLIHFIYPFPEKYADLMYKIIYRLEMPFVKFRRTINSSNLSGEKDTQKRTQFLNKRQQQFYQYTNSIFLHTPLPANTLILTPQSEQSRINFLNLVDLHAYFNFAHPFFRMKIIRFPRNNREMYGQCGTYHFRHDFRNANRNAIINHLIHKFDYQTYLEIGTNNCYHFADVRIPQKFGVDPAPPSMNPVYRAFKDKIYRMTSDEFFARLDDDQLFDIIFIDGCLMEENIHTDILNALKHIRLDGTIVVHDCNPPHEFFQRDVKYYEKHYNEKNELIWNNKGYTDTNWNGMTWKSIVRLIAEEGNQLEICVVDTDWGVGIIRHGTTDNQFHRDLLERTDENLYQYSTLVKYRRELLNLISVEEFLEKFE